MADTDKEQDKATAKEESKTNDYVTKADLEAVIAKYLNTSKTAAEENKNKEEDKSDVVAGIASKRQETETIKAIEQNLEKAYADRDKLNKLVDNLSLHTADQDFFKEIVKGHAVKNYNNEIDRINYTAKDVVLEFFNNPEFVKYLAVTDEGAKEAFTNLSETDKLQQATEYLSVINRAVQRMNDIESSKSKASGTNYNTSTDKYLQKYLRIREGVDYYKNQQQGV